MPRMPWPNSSPLIRLIWAVRSSTSRPRSRCERRKSSSSILGMRTSDQTCRSPRHQAISVRNSILTSTRSVLYSSPAPVYLEAARVDHKALNAAPHEEPRQPERVIAYFVADGDCWRRTAHLGPAVSGCSKLCHQLFRVSAFDWIEARLLPLRKLDRQKPAVLAQLQRAVKSIRRNRTGGCLVHLIISLDCKVWTKESTGRFR